MTKHQSALQRLAAVIADGTAITAALNRQVFGIDTITPVAYSLTPQALAELDADPAPAGR
jgi:hypothetical protein